MQILEMASRLELWHYIRCNAYINHVNVTDQLKHDLLTANDEQLRELLSIISYKLNLSSKGLKAVMNGDVTPMKRLVEDMSLIVSDRNSLMDFIKLLMFAHNIDRELLLKYTHTKPHEIKNIIYHGKNISNYTLNKIADTFAVNPKLMYNCFTRVGIKTIQPIKVPTNSKKKSRIRLRGYIRCLCYLNNMTVSKLSDETGFKGSRLMDIVLHGSQEQVERALEQMPFILHRPMKSFIAIMQGSEEPQKRTLEKINAKITSRKCLYTFVYALAYMFDTSTKALSENMGRSSTYVSSTLQNGTGQALSEMFTRISKLFNIPNQIFTVALARANVSSAYHTYLARMHFIVRYNRSPLKPAKMTEKDKEQDKKGQIDLSADYHGIENNIKNDKPQELNDSLRDTLADFSRFYGFNYRDFVNDNVKNMSNPHHRTSIRQNNEYHAIMNKHDIPVIIKKFRSQLDEIRNAFNLHEVQESRYATYVYVNGVHLSHPVARDAKVGLAKLGKGRHVFRAHFDVTDITQVNINPEPDKKLFAPTVQFKDITNDGKQVVDYMTFNYTRGFCKLGELQAGDLVSFTARVKPYLKGKYTRDSIKVIDYRLERPGRIRMIRRRHRREQVPVPDPKYKKSALVAYAMEHNTTAGYDVSLLNYKFIRNCKIQYKKWKESLKDNQ